MIAPLVTLTTALTGYLLADRAIGGLSSALGVAAPAELEPVIVALILGITTDYSIFFLSGLQRRLQDGRRNPGATRAAVREYLPIVLTAGVTVACGVAALVVARSGLFRELGPGLAVTVLVGLAVAITLVPALLGILGRWSFWPCRFPLAPDAGDDPAPAPGSDDTTGAPRDEPAPGRRSRVVALVADRRKAAGITVVVIGLLVVAALPLAGLRSSVAPVSSLPADNRSGWRTRPRVRDSSRASSPRPG